MTLKPLYFVECNRLMYGKYFAELDRDSNSRASVVEDIATGQLENVIKVLEVDEVDHLVDDVTEDIAFEVYEYLTRNGDGCPDFLRNWIDEHCGVSKADRLDRAHGVA